jgi:hypothetical protein
MQQSSEILRGPLEGENQPLLENLMIFIKLELTLGVLRVGVCRDSQTLKRLCGQQPMAEKTMEQEHFL